MNGKPRGIYGRYWFQCISLWLIGTRSSSIVQLFKNNDVTAFLNSTSIITSFLGSFTVDTDIDASSCVICQVASVSITSSNILSEYYPSSLRSAIWVSFSWFSISRLWLRSLLSWLYQPSPILWSIDGTSIGANDNANVNTDVDTDADADADADADMFHVYCFGSYNDRLIQVCYWS